MKIKRTRVNKITSKKYNIAKNTFVGVDIQVYAYTIDCKYIHSMKQCMKKREKYITHLQKQLR